MKNNPCKKEKFSHSSFKKNFFKSMKEKQTKPKKKKVRDEQELESEKLKQYRELIKSIPVPAPWDRFGINE